jgi:hypothetical protein
MARRMARRWAVRAMPSRRAAGTMSAMKNLRLSICLAMNALALASAFVLTTVPLQAAERALPTLGATPPHGEPDQPCPGHARA